MKFSLREASISLDIRATFDRRLTVGASLVKISIFHEPWWLSATTHERFKEAIVKKGDEVVGRLPYVLQRRGPFTAVRMPPFTHVLGPVVDAGNGKPQTRLIRRMSITRLLIDQLPPHSHFHQHIDPTLDDGLASADGLAFQERKFSLAPQYTFQIDCRRSLDAMWESLYLKTRQHIRRAEKDYVIRTVDDPKYFVNFYLNSLKASNRVNTIDFETFPTLWSECNSRDCGVILGAFDHDGTPVAMTFLVWGHGIMYYLLSMRAAQTVDSGVVGLLLWSAMKKANQLDFILDLDGVYSSGTVRFLSNFGGEIKARFMIRRSEMVFGALQFFKRVYKKDQSRFFT